MSCDLHLLCILSALIATGNCLLCMQCSSFSDAPCAGSAQNCSSPKEVCATTRIRNSGYYWQNSFYIRSCINATECDTSGIITGQYLKTLTSTTCCYTDNCTAPVVRFPVENGTANGLYCPSYVDKTMEPCDIKSKTQCTGDQKFCIRYLATTTIGSTKSSLYLGGCATGSMCNTSSSKISSDGLTIELTKSCNSSGNMLHRNMVTIIPTFLLLLGVFLRSPLSL
ncbi:phospholipase A2 inhibitor and Ly6/PLAUR domain-containing protein-like [Spea bombifrons]|uniref:phospholipase A2 inhibitor and Ly6/PLAUR domain-containing protein-like n=1 Tax=Spea bombifrons TaxID=233779 RepID=UPI00234AFF38|nr:phospholipase A2 inhibitor and Ly6/PLAUR domain-containing protein-like [Spea bombifrons]